MVISRVIFVCRRFFSETVLAKLITNAKLATNGKMGKAWENATRQAEARHGDGH